MPQADLSCLVAEHFGQLCRLFDRLGREDAGLCGVLDGCQKRAAGIVLMTGQPRGVASIQTIYSGIDVAVSGYPQKLGGVVFQADFRH